MPNSAVLIVDDEPLIRETVSELLSSAGLSTLAATAIALLCLPFSSLAYAARFLRARPQQASEPSLA
jgi:DNA-binding response OmpR family regulator